MAADPTGAGAIAEEVIEEAHQAMAKAQEAPKEIEGPRFSEVLESSTVQPAGAPGPDVAELLRLAREAQRAPEIPAMGNATDHRPIVSGLHRVLEDVMQGQNKMEEIVKLALSGRNFSASELLALQAGVYRFSQELELTSKVIEKGTSAVKQTMNTQV